MFLKQEKSEMDNFERKRKNLVLKKMSNFLMDTLASFIYVLPYQSTNFSTRTKKVTLY